MKKTPYLCGGIFFCLILEARKSRTRQYKNPIDHSTDQLSDSHIMLELNYVFSGVKSTTELDIIKVPVSQYKSCLIDRSRYLALTQSSDINAFKNELKQKNCDIYVRMSQFIEKYLSENKYEILVKSLIKTIIDDSGISSTEQFYTTATKVVEKSVLASEHYIELAPFLVSILNFIVSNRLTNKQGRDTFLEWYEQPKKHGPWVMRQNLDLGATISPKKVVPFISTHESNLNDTTLDDTPIELVMQQEDNPDVCLSLEYPDTIILDCYNLLVFDEKDFLPGKVCLSFDKLLPRRFTPNKICEEYKGRNSYWLPNAIEKKKLKSYPILLIPLQTDDERNNIREGYVGFIDKINLEGINVIIEWHAILTIRLNDIHFLYRELDLQAMEKNKTELHYPHWTIKCIDLFYALSQSPGITFPSIPEVTTLLPVISKTIESNTSEIDKDPFKSLYLTKYEPSRKELETLLNSKSATKQLKLEISNYYFGDNNSNHVTITKSYYFPTETTSLFSTLKKEVLILEQRDVVSNEDFTNTLPNLRLLVESLQNFSLPEYIFKIRQFEQIHLDKQGQLNDIIYDFITNYNELMQALEDLKNASSEKIIPLEKDFKLFFDTFSYCKNSISLILNVLAAQPECAPTYSTLQSIYTKMLLNKDYQTMNSYDIQVAFLNYFASLLNNERENFLIKRDQWDQSKPILKKQIDSLYQVLIAQETETGEIIERIFLDLKRNTCINTPELKKLYKKLCQ